MVGGRAHQKRITVEVSGPKSLLPQPVTRKVNFNLTFRDFLRDIVDRKKLVGVKVTTVKGTWKNAVCLDSIIKDFVQHKFARKKMDCYRIRLMKLKKKRRGGPSPDNPDQVVYTIDDEEDVAPVEPPHQDDAPPDMGQDGLGVGEDEQPCSSREMLEQTPLEPPGEGDAPPATQASGNSEVMDDEQPCSSRDMLEQNARDAASMPPPRSIRLEGNSSIKRESLGAAAVKFEIPDAESTIGYLRDNGVAIEDLKTSVRERMGKFKNPFLLLLKKELTELQNSGGPHWQSVVGKAPMCAHLLGELFIN